MEKELRILGSSWDGVPPPPKVSAAAAACIPRSISEIDLFMFSGNLGENGEKLKDLSLD
ncbi:hypothetical protein Golax_001386 [Gossypium laxum]|uniref:Uncharacterized protein n=1 Tax=Gossypium laxum TaxID=34288 RepID=A0A7J9AWV3_9ROSI|nr:hypothetical protein [Gossypium laxum]